MRSTTAGELTTLAAQTRSVTQRVKVANGSGTMVDYSSWVEEVPANIDIDRPVSALTVQFRRDSGPTLSLAPFRSDSTLNRLDDGVTYAPALDAGRSVTWEVATTPIGTLPQAADFKLLFKGTIDAVDFDHSPVVVECRDLGSVIVDRGIEVEAAYGSVAGVALETVMQANLDAVFGSGFIPLYTPVSPSYLISPAYIQQRQSEMDAQQALAQLPGWDVRYWWDSVTSAFRFTLQQPPRTKTVPDYTFGPGAYFDITRLSIDRTNIKNVVAVSYLDTATNTRLVVTVSDATSITKYGRRYFFLQEADGSPINTNAEATTMANSILSDMKEPKAEAEIEMPFFWPAELWDLYRFSANGVQINSNQDWAVVSISHKLTRNSHSTVLTVRGSPAGGYLTWLDRGGITGSDGRPGEVGPEARIEVFGSPSGNVWPVKYTGIGGTAPLTYQRRIDVDNVSTGAYSAVAALGSGVTENITVQPYFATRIFLKVIDATGLEGNSDPFFLQGELDPLNKTTGRVKRIIPFDDGKYAVKASDTGGGVISTGVRGSSDLAVNNTGLTTSFGVNRHNDEQAGVNGATKTFGVVFDGIPQMRALPQNIQTYKTGVATDQSLDVRAINVTASTYDARAKLITGQTASAKSNNPAATLNGTPVASVAIGNPASVAYWNLADANGVLTTYYAHYDVDTTAMDPSDLLYVELYRNNGTASTSWTLVDSRVYSSGATLSNQQMFFDYAMTLNYDLRILINYLFGITYATVTAKACTYDQITAGTEYDATAGAGAAVLFQAMEAP